MIGDLWRLDDTEISVDYLYTLHTKKKIYLHIWDQIDITQDRLQLTYFNFYTDFFQENL